MLYTLIAKEEVKMRNAWILAAVLLVSGCSHQVTLMERGGTMMGSGTVPGTLMNSGAIKINLAGEEYDGRWVLSKGGSFNLASMSGTAYGPGGVGSATAVGSGVNMNASGNGNILARSAAGKGLRCVFDYSGFSRTGIGLCQDDDGRLYDMQIN